MSKSTRYVKNSKKPTNIKKCRRSGRQMPLYLHILPVLLYVLTACKVFNEYYLSRNEMITMLIVIPAIYVVLANISWKIYYTRALEGASINSIDKMSGEEFEDYLALLYKKNGFEVRMTPKTCDFGADLLLKDPKTGLKICIQAKRYRGLVGEEAVQQTLSGREYYKCDKAMIITNSHYTDAAKKLAKSCDIAMIDRFKLGTKKMYQF